MSAPKALASVFRVQMAWEIRCEYCGHIATGDSMEVAGANFFEHMFFGQDSSLAHWKYARGERQKLRLNKAQRAAGGAQ